MGKKADTKAAAPPPDEDPPEEPPEEEEKLPGRECHGEFLLADGSTYQGQYLETGDGPSLHGQGELSAGPEHFQGRFRLGRYEAGRFSHTNGAVYNGTFRDNRFHGLGEYAWPDGRTYHGPWQDGKMHGKGEFQNFVVGKQLFSGFAVAGEFHSGLPEQEQARCTFLRDYEAACTASACSVLRDLAAKVSSKGAPRRFVVPGDHTEPGEPPMVAKDRSLAAAVLSGPCPEAAEVPKAGIKALAAALEEGAERPLTVAVHPDGGGSGFRMPSGRLRLPQWQVRGQAVEFSLPAGTEEVPGAVTSLTLVNISPDHDFAKARWKIAHIEAVPLAPHE